MPNRELEALRKAVEAAKKIVKKPIIETDQPEPAQARETPNVTT
jgi:hypothetical protein